MSERSETDHSSAAACLNVALQTPPKANTIRRQKARAGKSQFMPPGVLPTVRRLSFDREESVSSMPQDPHGFPFLQAPTACQPFSTEPLPNAADPRAICIVHRVLEIKVNTSELEEAVCVRAVCQDMRLSMLEALGVVISFSNSLDIDHPLFQQTSQTLAKLTRLSRFFS